MRSADSRITAARPVSRLRLARALVWNDTVIASVLVLAFCMGVAAFVFFLSWMVYRDRYGMSLTDFIQLAF